MRKNCTVLLVLFVYLLLPGQVWAQNGEEEIDTDRPDRSQGTGIVPQRRVQLETGFLREKRDEQIKVHAYPTALLRLGLLERVELRVQAALKDSVIENGAERRIKGFGPLSIGTKVRLWEESGWRPEAALMAMLALPVGSEVFRPDNLEPRFNLGFSNELSEKTDLTYNLGYGWTNGDPVSAYGVNVMRELTDRLTLFVEAFGEKQKGEQAEHQADLGLLYLLLPNLQLDVAAGMRLNKAAPHSFVTAGLAVRLPR